MKVHANAALGPAGRLALVEAIESGMTQKAAAAAFCVAPATAHRWWHRWRLASEAQQQSGAWLQDRSSRPLRQPRRLSAAEEAPILRARRETNLGPGRLAGICRRPRSTIWKRSNAFRKQLEALGARHILTPPYTPRWNGKVERFIQTLKREWAYAHSWPNSSERARAMPSFLRYYNRRRPHSSLGDRPPISRVHNVCG